MVKVSPQSPHVSTNGAAPHVDGVNNDTPSPPTGGGRKPLEFQCMPKIGSLFPDFKAKLAQVLQNSMVNDPSKNYGDLLRKDPINGAEAGFEPDPIDASKLTRDDLKGVIDFRDGTGAWETGPGKYLRAAILNNPSLAVGTAFFRITVAGLESRADFNEKIRAAEAEGRDIPLGEHLQDMLHLGVEAGQPLLETFIGAGVLRRNTFINVQVDRSAELIADLPGASSRHVAKTELNKMLDNAALKLLNVGAQVTHWAIDHPPGLAEMKAFSAHYENTSQPDW